jgi:amino acid transporter
MELISFIVLGIMIYLMMQALTELAVLYPVNGAFYTYIVRFIDPSWYVDSLYVIVLVQERLI